MYSKQQINILIKKGQKLCAHFDATGSVDRPTQYDQGKRLLYYALVVKANKIIIPIAEMISGKHDSAKISSFLLNFRHFCVTNCHRSWPVFNVIVTDWSFALLTSVCLAFNDMTLFMYLKICYKYVDNIHNDLNPHFGKIVILKSCCAHFIKMICNKIHKFKQKKDIRNIIVSAVVVLMECSFMEELCFQFKNVLMILLKPYYDNELEEAVK